MKCECCERETSKLHDSAIGRKVCIACLYSETDPNIAEDLIRKEREDEGK